ncbi:MAG: Stp1/IreP family PP2C-type Ser/Thr phosphatase [Eubacterium sp.]|nr:Stp1/IreP family PP2C-type Ser/Thr phosphatase [Eubacterium sp.]
MKLFSKSDIGKKREENQDRVWFGMLGENAAAIVLCDGMGGENAGSRASQMTVDFMNERLVKGFKSGLSDNSIRNLLITGVNGANSLVFRKSGEEEAFRGMGTTCIGALIIDRRAYIINVGDSRVYHIFGDNIQQITKDHTYIRKLIDDGQITEEESYTHPERNCITRAIGADEYITPDYFELDLRDDSILLFCSDGLHSYGSDSDIAEIIVNSPINKACDLLVNYALDKGGSDNISVCIAAI